MNRSDLFGTPGCEQPEGRPRASIRELTKNDPSAGELLARLIVQMHYNGVVAACGVRRVALVDIDSVKTSPKRRRAWRCLA